jgi:hypothetical protein
MYIKGLGSAFLLLATIAACDCKTDCSTCTSKMPESTPLAAGGLGIPYKTCATNGQCNAAALTASGLDPKGNLMAKNLCESGWCRGYYNPNTNSVCLDADQIKCAKSANVFGTATCNNGNFGACL